MEIVENNLGKIEYNYSTEFNTMKQYFANSDLNHNQLIYGVEYNYNIHQELQNSSPNNLFLDLFTIVTESIGANNTSHEFYNDCYDYVLEKLKNSDD